jgi:hypothetical protein
MRYIDPDGRDHGIPAGLESIIYQKMRENTKLIVIRNSEDGDMNDSAMLVSGALVIAEFGNVQSEKNYQTSRQQRSDRNKDDLSQDVPDATLPKGSDYRVTLEGDTKTRNDSMVITSKSAQIPGFSIKGIRAVWRFLVHATGDKANPDRTRAFSWGCQIFTNPDFKKLITELKKMLFAKGDSFDFEIR